MQGKRIEAINSDYDIHRVDGILDEMINETKVTIIIVMTMENLIALVKMISDVHIFCCYH